MQRKQFLLALCAAPLALASMGSFAQSPAPYPTKPIRLVTPFPPGGGTDFIARTLATKLVESKQWVVTVDNRAGASGTIGMGELARLLPTGYDLAVGQRDNLILAPWLQKVSFDTVKSFQPVAYLASTPMLIVASATGKYQSFADVVAASRAKPGSLTLASTGTGSATHIASELLRTRASLAFQHIPYKGSSPALTDLVGGQVDLAGSSIASAMALIKGGKLKPLVVMGKTRSPALPDVPTLAEVGIHNVEFGSWFGVFAPAGLSPEVARELNEEISRVVQRPEVVKAFQDQGLEPGVKSVQEFAKFVADDVTNVKGIFTETGVKPD
jgi:tripartite-type tricarboxylate transporter receptor subunit TctC